MKSIYREIAELLVNRKQCIALTGAGISAESGIPTFRSKGGFWEKYDPEIYASFEVFKKDPAKHWAFIGNFVRNEDIYQPNQAHYVLKEMEDMGIVRCIITQNIDGLHKKAGSRNVVEVHGNAREIICMKCGKEYRAPHIPNGTPPYCICGGILKPNIILFGEELPLEAIVKARYESMTCQTMLLIGTSAIVQPVASLPYLAKQNGAQIIEINIEKAFPDADYFIMDKAGIALSKIIEEIKKS